MTENWVRTFEHDGNYLESLDGVMWADAPLPPPWHRCKRQTRGWFGLNYIERCACGAARMSARGPWLEKNETRRGRARQMGVGESIGWWFYRWAFRHAVPLPLPSAAVMCCCGRPSCGVLYPVPFPEARR